MRTALLLAFLSVTCSCTAAGVENGPTSAQPPAPLQAPPTQCDPATQRMGTYLVHYDVESGNCGAIPDTLVVLNGATMAAARQNCTVVSSTVSHGGCREDGVLACTENGQSLQITVYTVQETQDGASIKGEATLVLAGTCTATYAITYTRR